MTSYPRRRLGHWVVVAVASLLVLSSCTSGSDEVIFGAETTDPPTTTPTPTPTPTPTEPTTTTAPTTETTAADTTGTTEQLDPAALTIPLSDTVLTELPGQVVVNGEAFGSVSVYGPSLEPQVLVEAPGELITQPTWSPNGEFVAWARGTNDGFASVVVASTVDGSAREFPAPFIAFYIQWRPDGRSIGLLGAAAGGTGLALLDLDAGTVTQVNGSQSYYFDWAPDGESMITHLDNSLLQFIDPVTAEVTVVDTETTDFQAAEWTPDGAAIVYIRPGVQSAGMGATFRAQGATGQELVLHNVETGEIEVLATAAAFISFSVSPDGGQVAYSAQGSTADTIMTIIDLTTRTTTSIDGGTIFVWQWSPDSEKILLLSVESARLVFNVWDQGQVTRYASAAPTPVFLNRYLVFWGQYDKSMTLWAPDSSAFVFSATDRGSDSVFLQLLEEEFPIRLAPGSIGAFSPVGN